MKGYGGQTFLRSKKAVLIILDGAGVGELPDAYSYADSGSSTLAHISNAVGGLRPPNLDSLVWSILAQSTGTGTIREVSRVRSRDLMPISQEHWKPLAVEICYY